ncbi:MAG: hypothetical protein FWG85_05330 [Bacteroidetes bacterium]|nr:hypothetical protein [Bacteroidota bacterium]
MNQIIVKVLNPKVERLLLELESLELIAIKDPSKGLLLNKLENNSSPIPSLSDIVEEVKIVRTEMYIADYKSLIQ